MKTGKYISAILAALLALSVFAGCSNTDAPVDGTDSDTDDVTSDTAAEDTVPVYVPEENPYTRPEETYEGVQGIVLRADAVPEASVIEGTQVTDVIVPAGAALTATTANLWLSVDARKADDTALAAVDAALAADGIYGIELDFIGMESASGDAYTNLDAVNEFVAKVSEKVDAKGDIKLSVLVYSDIYTNYDFGLDVSAWISDGCVDTVSPSSGGDYANTDIPVRLWSSLTDPYGVTLVPVIAQQIKPYAKADEYAQTSATLAGEAANFISQGADKICVGDWVSGDMLSVLGSYESLMAADRSHVLTYNSVIRDWRKSNVQLPKTISAGSTGVLRIQVGNVPEGAAVTLKLRVDKVPTTKPNVFANSQACEFIGIEGDAQNMMCYKIPAEVQDGGYIVAEIVANGSVVINHAEVVVEVE